MKNIITSLILVLTCAIALRLPAVPSWATLNTESFDGDESDGLNLAFYTGYYCTLAAAESKFGGSTADAITGYLEKHFSTDVIAGATAFDRTIYGLDQYTLDDYADASFASADYVAVVFYGSEAFRVFGKGSAELDSGNLIFDDMTAASGVGDWTTVPEPTGGLLLLLALAGLALCRTTSARPA